MADSNNSYKNKSRILVAGIGGAAVDVINIVSDWKLKGVDTVLIDVSKDATCDSNDPRVIYLTHHLIEKLETSPEDSNFCRQNLINELGEFINSIPQYDITFVVTGLGGTTGRLVIPYLTSILKEKSQWVWSLLKLPFFFEGKSKIINSMKGLKRVQRLSDAVLVIQHDKIFKMVDKNISLNEAFMPATKICTGLIESIYRLTAPSSWIKINLNEIKDELRNNKSTSFGMGEASGEDMINKAVSAALSDSLLDKELLSCAKGLVISILGGKDLKLKEIESGIDHLRKFIPSDVNIGFGAAIEKSWSRKTRVGIVALGIDSARDVSDDWDVAIATRRDTESVAEVKEPAEPIRNRFQSISQRPRMSRQIIRPRQTTIDFKSSFKGRFSGSNPTMHEGEDLDIPTFLRKEK